MTGIFLLGEHQNSDLVRILGAAARHSKQPLCLCEGEFGRITAPCGILLPGPSFSCRRLELCGAFWCVVDSAQEEAVRFAQKHALQTLTCGFSAYDTLTLSSITPEQAVVTLQREICTIDGTPAEPADLPLHLRQPHSPRTLLLSAAALILLGYGEQLGDFYL